MDKVKKLCNERKREETFQINKKIEKLNKKRNEQMKIEKSVRPKNN